MGTDQADREKAGAARRRKVSTASAIKCISMLLAADAASNINYKVIFMTRPIEEVVVSQAAMLNAPCTKGAELDQEQLQRGLRGHRERSPGAGSITCRTSNVIEIDYPTLVSEPGAADRASRRISRGRPFAEGRRDGKGRSIHRSTGRRALSSGLASASVKSIERSRSGPAQRDRI